MVEVGDFIYVEEEGQHAIITTHEAVDNLSSEEDILVPGAEPRTSSLRFEYLSTIIR